MASLATTALAQNPAITPTPPAQWPAAEIASGVAFQGDGSVKLELVPGAPPVVAFWRPVLFNEDSRKPVAGRMDCRTVAAEEPYTAAAFDPGARHDSVREARAQQGYVDMDRLRDIGETVKQVDIVGRRANPRQHYVLSYIMVRDGDRLIDIRRNCTFIFGNGVSKPDVLPYVYRFTRIAYAFEPNDGSPPQQEP
jgi:hypothetical protein